MFISKRQLATGAAGFCAFTNLYPIQALLPELMTEFNATAAQVGLTVAAGTLAVALTAPFAGILSDMLGRKPVIVASLVAVALVTLLTALSTSINSLIAWRFLAGFFIPGIFATTVAYIGEEWSSREAVETTAIYISGTVLGGFSGRLIAGIAADAGGWPVAFLALGILDLALVPIVLRWLPPSTNFRPGSGFRDALRAMARHLKNGLLVRTFCVSFGMLFSLVAVFSYVSLRLADPPFELSTSAIGGIFAVYLLGVVVTPIAGRQVARFGRARVALSGVALSAVGLSLTLPASLMIVVFGLALFSCGLFVLQGIATGFVPQVAAGNASAAVGLYITAYYIGGSLGAVVPGPLWHHFGWLGCVVLIWGVLAVVGVIAYRLWLQDPTVRENRSGV